MIRKLLATVVVILLTASTSAHAGIANTFVWFEAASLNPKSGVTTQGVEGGNLQLNCQTSSGPTSCQWLVTMRMHNLFQVSSAGTDLLGDTNALAITDPVDGPYPNSPYDNNGHTYTTPNSGGVLAVLKEVFIPVTSQSQYDTQSGLPGVYCLLTFKLTANANTGDTSLNMIDARVNSLFWTNIVQFGDAPHSYVSFGGAGVLDGWVTGGTAPGVIQIQNVPEPTTGALLALLGIAFTARRRHRFHR